MPSLISRLRIVEIMILNIAVSSREHSKIRLPPTLGTLRNPERSAGARGFTNRKFRSNLTVVGRVMIQKHPNLIMSGHRFLKGTPLGYV